MRDLHEDCPQVGVALIGVNKYSLRVTQRLVLSLLVVSFRRTGTNKLPAVLGSYMLVVFFPGIDEVSILIGISFAVTRRCPKCFLKSLGSRVRRELVSSFRAECDFCTKSTLLFSKNLAYRQARDNSRCYSTLASKEIYEAHHIGPNSCC